MSLRHIRNCTAEGSCYVARWISSVALCPWSGDPSATCKRKFVCASAPLLPSFTYLEKVFKGFFHNGEGSCT